MSAYIVDEEHIAYLVNAAVSRAIDPCRYGLHWYVNGTRHGLEPGASRAELTRVGQMLWTENVRSVAYRYPNDTPDNLPGPIGAHPYRYVHRNLFHVVAFEPVQVIVSIHCYEYQTCEHPEWEASEAHAFCEALESAAIHALPGYKNAIWGAPRATLRVASLTDAGKE